MPVQLNQFAHYWRRHPSHAVWIVGVLVVASSVTTAVWTVADGLWLRPLPFASPEQLVTLAWTTPTGSQPEMTVSADEAVDIRAAVTDLMTVANIEVISARFTSVQGVMTPLSMAFATTNLFDVLGVDAAAGRTFVAEDSDAAGGVPRAIVTDRLWRRLFPDATWLAGRTIDVRAITDTQTVEIVGVLAPRVETPGLATSDVSSIDLFAAMPDGRRAGGAMSRRVLDRRIIGRLNAGVTPKVAEERMTGVLRQIDEAQGFKRVRTATLPSLHQSWLGRSEGLLGLLAAAAGLVLLVALSNLAGLLAIIRTRRTHEHAIRSALGAGPGRLRVVWLAELVPLALPAGLLGGLLAVLLVSAFQSLAPAEIPRLDALRVDALGWIVAGATASMVLLLAGSAGLPSTPGRAWSPLQGHGTSSGSGRRRILTHGIVAVQTALVLTLLAGAALITTTLWRMLDQPLGFRADGLAIVQIRPTQPHFRDAPRYQQLMDEMRRAVLALPGNRTVALAFDPPLAEVTSRMRVAFTHREPTPVSTKYITDGFMQTVGATMVAGRDFVAADFSGPAVVLVNDRFAKEYFGSPEAALGKSFEFGPPHEIVGVVSDMREGPLTSPLTPVVYPLLDTRLRPVGMFHLISREGRGSEDALRGLEEALRRVDPSANIKASWLAERLRAQTAVTRTQAFVLGTLAIVTFALALLGIYATIRQLVDDRRRELAIRAALGATPQRLVTLTLRGTAASVAVGVGLGGWLSVLVAEVTQQFLFNTSPFDPVVWGGASLLLIAAALISAGLPAREAGRANPIFALRAGD